MDPKETPGLIVRNGLPLASRLLEIQSVDQEARTVEVVWSTGAAVRRWDWDRWRYYDESLSMDAAHCDLSRLNNGAPVLNTHQQWDLGSQLGVVERAWLVAGEGRAILRFSRREDVEPYWQDIVDKIIRNISVGYIVRAYEITEREGQTPEYRAVDWQPTEISFVPVPADAGAGTRSASRPDDAPTFPVQYRDAGQAADTVAAGGQQAAGSEQRVTTETRQEEPTMTPEEIQAKLQQERKAAIQAENERQGQIRKLTDQYPQFGAEFARTLLDDPACDIHRARELVLEKLATGSEANQERANVNYETLRDEAETRRERMIGAIMVRAGVMPAAKAGDAVLEYRGMNMADLAAECVRAAGGKTRGLTKHEIVSAALGGGEYVRAAGMHSTSDFPILLSSVINRTLRDAYANVQQTWLPLSRKTTAPDFREMVEVSMGDFPDLAPLQEGGEYKSGTIKEYSSGWKLGTFARKIAITRQALINDDLQAFSRLPVLIAQAAARTQNNLAWDVIIKNQNCKLDNKPLFHADHKNQNGTPAALDVSSLSGARKALRQQKSADGAPFNLEAAFLIVGSGNETAADMVLASVTPRNASDVNPFAGKLTPIVEPRLDDLRGGNDFFLAINPALSPVDLLLHAFLEGQEGLYTETKQTTDVDGVEMIARMDFGVCAGDYRGIYRQFGAAS